jgi:molybdopterin molybdotransferase
MKRNTKTIAVKVRIVLEKKFKHRYDMNDISENKMLSVEEARNLVMKNSPAMKVTKVQLKDALGYVLAENIFSPLDVPPFNQSAMDGYAFQLKNNSARGNRIISGEVQAGTIPKTAISSNNAVRIFTGAQVPDGADAIVMQEKVERSNDSIIIHDEELKEGSNIRLKGSYIKKGAPALQSGTKLTPGAVGFLAAIGIAKVKVYAKPSVSIIVTGKELVKPGRKLIPGSIYESNSLALSSALKEMGIIPKFISVVDDDEKRISTAVKKALSKCDLIIISGGVSVGDYDFVQDALKNCGVKKIFYAVKQKPGKPLFFGRKKAKLVFALPGNPSAALTCFYEYIIPCIKNRSGIQNSGNKKYLRLSSDYYKKEGLTYFLKGKISGDEVITLPAQESSMMNSFAVADCLIHLSENRVEYKKGEQVEIHLLK